MFQIKYLESSMMKDIFIFGINSQLSNINALKTYFHISENKEVGSDIN
jgi:hypothetical protein